MQLLRFYRFVPCLCDEHVEIAGTLCDVAAATSADGLPEVSIDSAAGAFTASAVVERFARQGAFEQLVDLSEVPFLDADSFTGLVSTSVMGAAKFKPYRPESVDPVPMSQFVYFAVGNLMTNVDFRLNSARRIVGHAPKISGSPKIGKRLTVKVGGWLPKPVATTCKWYVGSKVVKRQCASLKVKASYWGKRIRVKVTGWRSGYGSKTLASRATSKVHRKAVALGSCVVVIASLRTSRGLAGTGGLVAMNAVRVVVGGIAALVLLVPSVAPSWAAGDDDVTVTGVVRLDEVPTAGVEICDLHDHGNCVRSGSGGTFTIVPKLVTITAHAVTSDKRCLSVTPTDDYRGLNVYYKGDTCELSFSDAEPGSVVNSTIDLTSYPLAWGQVVNRAGRPIVGASVASGNGRPESLTDARGRFRVKMGPYMYDEHYLRVSAAGYQLVAARFSSDGDLSKIVMPAEGDGSLYSISGRVVDEKGRPYVGVKVCIVHGECIGTVGDDGHYYGLLASPPASTGYDGVGFALYLPGMSEATLMFHDVSFIQRSFVSNVDFALDGARHLVGPTPRISGSPKVGKRLTVRVRTWLPRPVSTSCAWYVGSKLVKRGCSSLRVKSSYRGKRIRVKVTGSRSGYGSKTVASRATSRVYR